MISLSTTIIYLPERPQNVTQIDITDKIQLWLDQPLDNFSVSFYGGMQESGPNFEYAQIDHVNPVINSNAFTVDLNDAEFTFISKRDFFTLREICECFLAAWKAPLNEKQLANMSKTFDMECFTNEMSRSVLSLDSMFPAPSLNGLYWCNGKFYASEMQD